VVGEGRDPAQVNPVVRQRVAEMETHNLALGANEDFMRHLEPPAVGRLGAIRVPTLVIIGDRDVAYIRRVADVLASDIAGARKVVMYDTAHVPNMEQPEAFNQLVLDFLAGI
jgi:pimeloyl-ACP methyl ester carboxylesterase